MMGASRGEAGEHPGQQDPLAREEDMTSGVFLISRRVFLRLGASAITLGGVSLLGACAPNSAPPQATQPAPPQTPTALAGSTPAAQPVAQHNLWRSPPTPNSASAPTVGPTVTTAVTPTSRGARTPVELPTYVALAGITPDLPPSADGLVTPDSTITRPIRSRPSGIHPGSDQIRREFQQAMPRRTADFAVPRRGARPMAGEVRRAPGDAGTGAGASLRAACCASRC